MKANQNAAAIRSGWATTEKNFAACERFALGEPNLRAQTRPRQRRPVGQSDGSDKLAATLAADRAFPAAVAELGLAA